MASPLHDNPKSKKADDKPAPPEPNKAEQDAKGAEDSRAAAKAKAAGGGSLAGGPNEPAEPSKATEAAGEDAAAQGESPKDKFMDGMKNIHKRHESERRDTHGNHREALRQMHARHNKEISDHFDLHFGEGTDSAVEGAARANSPKPQGGDPVDEE